VKATLHWVSAEHAITGEVRIYDHLFTVPEPAAVKDADFKDFINPNSLITLKDCKLEPGLIDAKPGSIYQFERQGYFCVDTRDSKEGFPVFNRSVALRDTWAKIKKKQGVKT